MPIYEYVCPGCDTTFEKMRPLSQSDRPCECPSCKTAARRKMSVFSAFGASLGGVPKAVSGTNGPSCASCGGGSCASCG